jgi:ribosomal protein L7Ae-like RNA K-turn-binding protein
MGEVALGMLGLGARAGSLVAGTSGVRAALQRGEVALVVVAEDHGPRTEEKVLRLARGKGVRTVTGPGSVELGRRIGRGAIQCVGVRDERLAAGMLRAPGANARRS